tara:strand:- start:89 stop:232 length:144 start_codon:yes stop_codon:yes gene_type:complete
VKKEINTNMAILELLNRYLERGEEKKNERKRKKEKEWNRIRIRIRIE